MENIEKTSCKIVDGAIHSSKKFPFRGECGGCGRPLRRNSKNKIGYLCKKCRMTKKISTENNDSVCLGCPFEFDCTMRVQSGFWVRCEMPDIADIERLKLSGELDIGKLRTELEETLERKGNRQALEAAISQSAKALYQSDFTRR